MKAPMVVAVLVLCTLAACTKSDELRDSVAGAKATPAAPTAPLGPATASEVPNSVTPDDIQLGGGIRH